MPPTRSLDGVTHRARPGNHCRRTGRRRGRLASSRWRQAGAARRPGTPPGQLMPQGEARRPSDMGQSAVHLAQRHRPPGCGHRRRWIFCPASPTSVPSIRASGRPASSSIWPMPGCNLLTPIQQYWWCNVCPLPSAPLGIRHYALGQLPEAWTGTLPCLARPASGPRRATGRLEFLRHVARVSIRPGGAAHGRCAAWR